jgi:leucyl/phenylalanyl-tRNA--protein transferase
MLIFELDTKDVRFPFPGSVPEKLRSDDGLFAFGGDLSPERLIQAYANGIFPWVAFRLGELHWYCPINRFVIFPNEIHISHSMRNIFNKNEYVITFNKAFDQVISACSNANDRFKEEGAWLGKDMIMAYTQLYELGWAYSVEVWDVEANLVGGLYGVGMNGCFFGESMFSYVPNGSKIALIKLAQHMQEIGGKMIDCQLETSHLRSMGGRFVSYEEYMNNNQCYCKEGLYYPDKLIF